MTVRVGLLGVPLATIYPANRAIATEQIAKAPEQLRKTQWLHALQTAVAIEDAGDLALSYPLDPSHMKELSEVFATIDAALFALWEKVPFVVVQGGGCGMASGTFAAFARRFPKGHVLWFDSHADFNTYKTTVSHYLGGLALSTAIGAADLPPAISPRQVTVLSGRAADWNEITLMTSLGVGHVYPEQIEQWVQNDLPPTDLFVHFDVDVLEQSVMPAVDLPIVPGIPLSLAEKALRQIAGSGRLRGIEFTVYNPTLDPQGIGRETLTHLTTLTLSAWRQAYKETSSVPMH